MTGIVSAIEGFGNSSRAYFRQNGLYAVTEDGEKGKEAIVPAPYFKPVIFRGEVFDLTHLEPFSFDVDSRISKKRLRVHVTFSDHCFTRSYDP
jgi:hypothetical protein